MKTTISSKGQIVLPAAIRKQDHIRPGQSFEIQRVEPGRYVLTKSAAPPNEGIVDWLLNCPDNDWFERIPSESTATL